MNRNELKPPARTFIFMALPRESVYQTAMNLQRPSLLFFMKRKDKALCGIVFLCLYNHYVTQQPFSPHLSLTCALYSTCIKLEVKWNFLSRTEKMKELFILHYYILHVRFFFRSTNRYSTIYNTDRTVCPFWSYKYITLITVLRRDFWDVYVNICSFIKLIFKKCMI